MAPAPALAAILGDVVWCVGIGCLLGALRCGWGLLAGEGPLRSFVGDLLAFAAAAVLLAGFAAAASAGGLARWYMAAAMAAGAIGWHYSVQRAVSRLVNTLAVQCARPGRWLARRVWKPMWARFAAENAAAKKAKMQKKTQKAQKKRKNQLPNECRVYYN